MKEAVKAKHKFLFPTKAVAQVYRAYFLKHLQQQIDKSIVTMTEEQHKDWLTLRTALYEMDWIVDFRKSIGGPAQVLEYLGRFTHKVAISNHRIKGIDMDDNVTFDYKDYTDDGKKKSMTLSGEEFLRRYEQHILNAGFCKIRHLRLPWQLQTKRAGKRNTAADEVAAACTADTGQQQHKNDRIVWDQCTFAPNSCAGFGQQGVEQKAPIHQKYRGFIYGAYRLLYLVL